MKKYEVFVRELKYIENLEFRENVKQLIECLPDYFFQIPASSTGKYHPKFSLGKGGLVRHTKVAVRIAFELLNTKTFGNVFSGYEKDYIYAALLLHDGLKEGTIQQAHTLFEHPILVSDFIRNECKKLDFKEDDISFLASLVESHMGEWNTNSFSKVVLPLPETECQKFVHLCDYLASRRFLNVSFQDDEIID